MARYLVNWNVRGLPGGPHNQGDVVTLPEDGEVVEALLRTGALALLLEPEEPVKPEDPPPPAKGAKKPNGGAAEGAATAP